MNSKGEVRFLSEQEYPTWTQLVSESPDGSIYSTPEYLDALCGSVGGRFRIFALTRADELLGGIALFDTPSRFGPVAVPRLLLHYNGIVLRKHQTTYPSQRTASQLTQLAALMEALETAGYARLSLKCRHTLTDARIFLQAGWTVRVSYTYVVTFKDVDEAWQRVDRNLRRLIRRCDAQGMRLSDDDDFESFYRMHVQTLERKGASPYLPRRAFGRYFERLRALDLCRLYHARLPDGRSVASQLVLTTQHPVTHTVSAAADAQYLPTGASSFLRWKVFEELATRGFEANDLTDASLGPVTRFKAQLGGDLRLCLVLSYKDAWQLAAVERVKERGRRVREQLRRRLAVRANSDRPGG